MSQAHYYPSCYRYLDLDLHVDLNLDVDDLKSQSFEPKLLPKCTELYPEVVALDEASLQRLRLQQTAASISQSRINTLIRTSSEIGAESTVEVDTDQAEAGLLDAIAVMANNQCTWILFRDY